ncbi:MAG TPA: hypothetical protein VM243_07060 [Phycisphaerae bacterium]|nr:hypothetical protein [Phycisphaerae bacterium]
MPLRLRSSLDVKRARGRPPSGCRGIDPTYTAWYNPEMPGDPYSEPFNASTLVGRFCWSADMTADFDADCIYHRCHVADLPAFEKEEQLTMRSSVAAIRPDSQLWETRAIFLHLNVMQWSAFGSVEISLPLTVLEGRRFHVFRRSVGGNRHLYLLQHQDASALVVEDEATVRDPLATLFERQKSGKYNRKWDERVEIILTTPAAFDGARISAIAHQQCRTPGCGELSDQEARNKLKAYFHEHPSSPFRDLADATLTDQDGARPSSPA